MDKSIDRVPRLPEKEFMEIVRMTPLVSFDLLVREPRGKILVGWRRNEPAKGYWFVPGGIIRKGEILVEAFARITRDELGRSVSLANAKLKGIFEHIYEKNAAGLPGFGTHYIVLAHEIKWPDHAAAFPEAQHEEYDWLTRDEIKNHPKVHPYTKAYFVNE